MPTDIATDASLLERLSMAAKQGVTAAERRKQRLSFVYANLPRNSEMTRHEVEAALERLDAMEGRN